MGWFPEQPRSSTMLPFQFDNPADEANYLAGDTVEARCKALYGAQTQMCALALPMTRYRPWVIDYFEQFPALPIWLGQGVTQPHRITPKQAEMIQRTIIDVFEGRPKLRNVMRRWSIPQPMRNIHPKAPLPRHADLLRLLCDMNPSMIAQAMPKPHPKRQRVWLNVLDSHKARMFETRFWPWIVRELGTHNGTELFDMIDYFTRANFAREARVIIDLNWTWDQAAAARERWHEALARQKANVHGIPVDEVICRNPMPDEVEIDGFKFIALRTPEAIHLEGAAMHHCVASYTPRVMRGSASIVSCQKDGRRIATMEMTPMSGAVQTRGPCNGMNFPAGFTKAARQYDAQYRKAHQQ